MGEKLKYQSNDQWILIVISTAEGSRAVVSGIQVRCIHEVRSIHPRRLTMHTSGHSTVHSREPTERHWLEDGNIGGKVCSCKPPNTLASEKESASLWSNSRRRPCWRIAHWHRKSGSWNGLPGFALQFLVCRCARAGRMRTAPAN